MTNEERCTCGDSTVSYHPDENQHEPNCWDCYYQEKEAFDKMMKEKGITPQNITPVETEDDLPF